MEKLSEETQAKFAAVMAEVPSTLRALRDKCDSLEKRAMDAEAEIARRDERARIEKIAATIEAKNLDGGRSHDERIAALEKKASEGKLDVVEEAVGMQPMNVEFGELIDPDRPVADPGASEFVSYILGES